MKTFKIILGIAGFAITSICFGQDLTQNSNELLFYSAQYNLASNRLEHNVNQYPARTTSGDNYDAPVLNLTYFVPLEFDMNIEDWMVSAFESSFYEEEIQLEPWMVSPFESSVYEEDVQLETWMESPFDCIYYEPDNPIESWMCKPFESGEDIEVEDWMTTPWI